MKRGGNMDKDPFEEYLKESEPDKASKGYAWSTAIGLQAVDGLKPSKYLIDIAIRNIIISYLSGVVVNTPKEFAVNRDLLIWRIRFCTSFIVIFPSILRIAISIKYLDGFSPSTA